MHIHTRRKKTRINAFKKKHHLRKTKKSGGIVKEARQVVENITDMVFPSTQRLGKNTSIVYNDRNADKFKPDSVRHTNLKKGSIVPMG